MYSNHSKQARVNGKWFESLTQQAIVKRNLGTTTIFL